MTKIKSFSDSKARELEIQFPHLESVRTAATSVALQLQGGRDQKTSTVGESETKEFLKHSIL